MDEVGIQAARAMGVEGRRAVIAELMLTGEGYSRSTLSTRFGVAVTTIVRDEQIIRKEWRAARLANADVLLSQDLAELSMVKRCAWEVYRDSLEGPDAETGETKKVVCGGGTQTEGATEVTPVPNLKALELVTKCLERKQKLLGYGEDQEQKKRDKQRCFAFTVKIGDRVLAAESSDIDAEEIEAEDAEYYEVGADGKKLLMSGNDDGGALQ